jgi:hypothetical protein
VPPPGCGLFTPAKWFNLGTTDQVTLQYAVPVLNSDTFLPYLYGCLPRTASNGFENITFTYNQQNLITYWRNFPEAVHNISYIQTTPGNYNFYSAYYHSSENIALSTRYDSIGRLVDIETDAISPSVVSRPEHHRQQILNDLKFLSLKRSIQVPAGDINYHYTGSNLNLVSGVVIGWHGINQLFYNYQYDFSAGNLAVMNVTVQQLQDIPFSIIYQFFYDKQGNMNYYCVNNCNQFKITFSYDSNGRFTGAKSTQGTIQSPLVTITYDTSGHANQVHIDDDAVWILTY